MQAQQGGRFEDNRGTDQPARADEDRTQTGDHAIRGTEIGRAFSTTIEDEQLVLAEHGFGHHRSRTAGTGESGNGHQQMQKQDGQIAHRRILPRGPGKECSRIWNSPWTGGKPPFAQDRAKVVRRSREAAKAWLNIDLSLVRVVLACYAPKRMQRAVGVVIATVAVGLSACATRAPVRTPTGRSTAILETREGLASYYGKDFHGKISASGARFNMNAMVAAHPSYPFGTLLLVTNLANGRSTRVRILDRGPTPQHRADGIVIDLSRRAAEVLGFIQQGRARVRLEVLEWGKR
jgi:rare lipoprotein A